MRSHALPLGVAGALVVALLFLAPPFAQPVGYHDFADTRSCGGLPNCADTASNAAFALAGLWGLFVLFFARARPVFLDVRERIPYGLFFVAVILVAFGSAWYHLAPDNLRLVWDRAAMALAFMAWLCAILAERVGVKFALALLAPLMAAGLGAVFYWHWSEMQGAGDLRPWLLVQLMPIVLVPLLVWRYPPRYRRGADAIIVVGLYLVALLFDAGDDVVFDLTGGWVSGHTLKHLVAAFAACWVAHHLRRRRRI